jgi:hypothetical protein
MTDEQIRNTGIDALLDALGPAGMMRFLQQYARGAGDYTRDRHKWLGNPTVDELVDEIEARRDPSA